MRWLLAFALGCQSGATDLATYLEGGKLELLDRATWDRVVVPEFRALYDDYVEQARFTSAAWSGPVVTRKHFAGDPALTPNQARARWLLPVMFPSEIATAGGVPLDAVFVPERGRWFALVGIDRAIRARVDRLDPACGETIDVPAPSKTCRDASFVVAETSLVSDPTRFHRACAIARTACAKPSP